MENGWPLGAALAALALGGFVLLAVMLVWAAALRKRKAPHRLGDVMANARAEAVEWADGRGLVRADGELWRATSPDAIAPGDKVAVTRVDGLTLEVRKKA